MIIVILVGILIIVILYFILVVIAKYILLGLGTLFFVIADISPKLAIALLVAAITIPVILIATGRLDVIALGERCLEIIVSILSALVYKVFH